jgi:hypothetical protein
MVIIYQSPDILSRYDRIGYALAGSVASGIVLLLIVKYCMTDYYPISGNNLGSLSLLAILSGVVIQTGIAGFLGIAFGSIRLRVSDQKRNFNDRQQPWDYAAGEIREEEVLVRTKTNGCVQGIVARYGQGKQAGDIVISPVGPRNREELEVGDSDETDALYVRQSSISEIHFVDDEQEDEYQSLLSEGDIELEDVEEESDNEDPD